MDVTIYSEMTNITEQMTFFVICPVTVAESGFEGRPQDKQVIQSQG